MVVSVDRIIMCSQKYSRASFELFVMVMVSVVGEFCDFLPLYFVVTLLAPVASVSEAIMKMCVKSTRNSEQPLHNTTKHGPFV